MTTAAELTHLIHDALEDNLSVAHVDYVEDNELGVAMVDGTDLFVTINYS